VTIAICFGQFGPYHHARVVALQAAAHEQGARVVPVQIAAATTTYEWSEDPPSRSPWRTTTAGQGRCNGLVTLCAGADEAASPLDVFLKARKLFRDEKVDVAFLPSYAPARYFALFAAAKSLGIRTVMMNESHAGTEQATGWKRWIKRQIVKRFDAALVGGEPHKRHFASLGIPAEKIFTGYDAVDNDFFAQRADEIRAAQRRSDEWRVTSDELLSRQEVATENLSTLNVQHSTAQNLRSAYSLPERYFLSLGRMVEKKNLATLVSAYARYAQGVAVAGEKLKVKGHDVEKQAPVALVFVGSGELENALREQARSLGLRVVDCTAAGSQSSGVSRQEGTTANCKLQTEHSVGNDRGAVFFYGFRQIEENSVFYALAEAFVLPSLKEEWGLVVNEAMAAGLPVIVSRTAGCAEDLLPEATASRSSQLAVDSGQFGGSETTENCKPQTENSLELRSNGFVFDPSSVDALATALTRVACQETKRLKDKETSGVSEMGKRSREIVAKFGCENFAKQAMRAAEAAQQA
jgi:glycosyltransferase involved in cell wall biosynthesis